MLHFGGAPPDFARPMVSQVHDRFVGGDPEHKDQRAADEVPDMVRLQVPRGPDLGVPVPDPDRRVLNLSVHGCPSLDPTAQNFSYKTEAVLEGNRTLFIRA
jgi:hypothetical protein